METINVTRLAKGKKANENVYASKAEVYTGNDFMVPESYTGEK